MSKFVRTAAIATLTAGLLGGTAVAASAQVATDGPGNGPSPSPSQQQLDYQRHHNRPVVTPWQFDLQQSDIGGVAPSVRIDVNNVESGRTGILMRNWTDTQINPFVDKFSRGVNSVTLLHDSIGLADIEVNLRTCSVGLDQTGRFRVIAGTGTGAGFRSVNGQFLLRGLLSFDLNRNGRCPLRFLSDRQILRAIVSNGPSVLPAPTFNDIAVQGRADLVRVTPLHIFAPTAGPTDTPTGTPTDTVTPASS